MVAGCVLLMKEDASQHQYLVIRAAASCRPREPAVLGLLPTVLAGLYTIVFMLLIMALRHQKYMLVKLIDEKFGARSGL